MQIPPSALKNLFNSIRTISLKCLARCFDLPAAVRFSETTFKENAGTKVVTDILIMQKCIKETEEVPL
jgi:hypothetical protein